ncbi:hypothetical protein AGIG_G18793 [Arapaima gigas]
MFSGSRTGEHHIEGAVTSARSRWSVWDRAALCLSGEENRSNSWSFPRETQLVHTAPPGTSSLHSDCPHSVMNRVTLC